MPSLFHHVKSLLNSFILGKQFVVVRVFVDPECFPESFSTRQKYTLEKTPVHCRGQCKKKGTNELNESAPIGESRHNLIE